MKNKKPDPSPGSFLSLSRSPIRDFLTSSSVKVAEYTPRGCAAVNAQILSSRSRQTTRYFFSLIYGFIQGFFFIFFFERLLSRRGKSTNRGFGTHVGQLSIPLAYLFFMGSGQPRRLNASNVSSLNYTRNIWINSTFLLISTHKLNAVSFE